MPFINIKFRQIVLLICEIGILYLSLFLMIIIRFQVFDQSIWQSHSGPFSLVFLLWMTIYFLFGFFEIGSIHIRPSIIALMLKSFFVNILLAMSFFYIADYLEDSIINPKRNIAIVLIIFVALDILLRYLLQRIFERKSAYIRVAFVGYDPKIKEIINQLESNTYSRYKACLLIEKPTKIDKSQFTLPIIDFAISIENLKKQLQKEKIQQVVITDEDKLPKEMINKMYQCLPLKINFISFTKFYEGLTGKVPVKLLKKVWFLANLREAEKRNYEKIKRFIDLLFGLILGLCFIFSFPFVAIGIKLSSKGSIFFTQTRVGLFGKTFQLIKLRSMIQDAEKNGAQWWQQNDTRVTMFGKFLRKTHLDELPQFINILKGEMSIVGPRPERPEFVHSLTQKIPFYQVRQLVKPGLAGWAQLKYKYGSTAEDALAKLQYDIFYIKHRSSILDITIFLKTVIKIVVDFKIDYQKLFGQLFKKPIKITYNE